MARRGALLHPSTVPRSLSPHLSLTILFLSGKKRTVSSKFFDTQLLAVSTVEFVLSRHARCVLSHLRCTRHSLLLNCHLSRFGKLENFSGSARCHTTQDTSHLILSCPATYSLRRSLLTNPFQYNLWSRPRGIAGFWGSLTFNHNLRKWSGDNSRTG